MSEAFQMPDTLQPGASLVETILFDASARWLPHVHGLTFANVSLLATAYDALVSSNYDLAAINSTTQGKGGIGFSYGPEEQAKDRLNLTKREARERHKHYKKRFIREIELKEWPKANRAGMRPLMDEVISILRDAAELDPDNRRDLTAAADHAREFPSWQHTRGPAQTWLRNNGLYYVADAVDAGATFPEAP